MRISDWSSDLCSSDLGGPRPTTNDEWNAKAVQALLNIGYDAIAVQNAIGKFLQRRPLNLVEAQLVEAAVAAAGYPPENPPWVKIGSTSCRERVCRYV